MMKTIKKVVILGSSALKIGEAGEFDYSGSQAIKALKEEGIFTVLINPNIATIQTSEHLADKVYFLPVTPWFVERIIEKEKPDGILLGFGGQTALNCGVELAQNKVFEKHNITVLGTQVSVIEETEDRQLFANKLAEIDVKVPRSVAVETIDDALKVAEKIGYPVMIRIAYALGGLGSGLCQNEEEVRELASKAFAYTKQILVEEYLHGWKEVEYEVMRDSNDNCITVCNMENFDPMGIHTGESIVVAPSQTLSNHEYHKLREIAIRVIRHLGIVGECNIQYALDAKSDDYRVIEVNARLSRSSALASKATGYPLAFIAAKLALGHSLVDLKNAVTQTTMACFEPALDYIVVKIPRWDLKKFRMVSKQIGSSMKSVGEVMAIGRNFEETLQKALRMLEIGVDGLVGNEHIHFDNLQVELKNPTDERIFAIPDALQKGLSVTEIHNLTNIDRWFLYKIKNMVDTAEKLRVYAGGVCPKSALLAAKKVGFSDSQIAKMLRIGVREVAGMRKNYGITPVVKQIDTLAAEYPAKTNFLYLTYNGDENDVKVSQKKTVIVLGSGVYRIGSSVEFDWCCVNAVMTLKAMGYHTVMINYNPETVSTDYDECDRLYFEELTFETVTDIYEKEKPMGILISMGGQTPNNLALKFHEAGMTVLGTSPLKIDQAEDRHKFSSLLDQLGVDQPEWSELSSINEARNFATKVGYPVLIRPSYVLSGSAMAVASNDRELEKFLGKAADISKEHPVVISKFIENAKEIEFDGVAKDGELICHAISEHVENAGVHSGDATLVLPPQRTFIETLRQIRLSARKIAKALQITGPFNMQFIARDNKVKVIECNLRASRSFPFVSKVYNLNFIDIATRVILGEEVENVERSYMDMEYVGVKAPHFSFTRLLGADPTLGVEMSSTGEVACLGDDFQEAFLKAMLSVGFKKHIKSVLLSAGPLEKKPDFVAVARQLNAKGIKLYATGGTARFLHQYGIEASILHWPLKKEQPNVADYLREGKIDLVINIPKNFQEEELTNDYIIRRKAVDFAIPLITEARLARRFLEAVLNKSDDELHIKSWDEYWN
ncbi:MAG: carbamoyl-phosphate synthase (glutamine-hydrolyzing) large subunit [Deferribacteres bacterium]|nr:carbamoyl-phosphate synthase (glutamine-hydrolyzing) large subunit [candidate division KSB1 bacterium]MCB9501806.1 carbamoyl-phosphate synthase (glutamine-hydrolyzing) large subunit [Deferribacteres bacterium]